MIAIVNVSSEGTPDTGPNQYEVRINQKVICSFKHYREKNGLAQCLRDAADAVDKDRARLLARIVDHIQGSVP